MAYGAGRIPSSRVGVCHISGPRHAVIRCRITKPNCPSVTPIHPFPTLSTPVWYSSQLPMTQGSMTKTWASMGRTPLPRLAAPEAQIMRRGTDNASHP
eukprot:scaffold798_cov367-Pavlova_lutheri.AAC.2